MRTPITLVWFRRDLRLFDNTALQTAVRRGQPVAGVFVLENGARNRRRASFAYDSAAALRTALAAKNVPLHVLGGQPQTEIPRLAHRLGASAVVYAEDYAPQAVERDNRVWLALAEAGIEAERADDFAVLPKAAVMAHNGRPFTAFEPYKNAWLQTYAQRFGDWQPNDDWAALAALQARLPAAARETPPLPEPSALGFDYLHTAFEGGEAAAQKQLARFWAQIGGYRLSRDFPAQNGTARLSPYLGLGLLSPRHLVRLARQHGGEDADTWLNGLIWREFFQQAAYHRAEVAGGVVGADGIPWENNAAWFERWKEGLTGYPLVDAAMRQLKHGGWMHGRLRMLAAGFLVHGLLIDPRWGEAWFAEQLVDFDEAANSGGWRLAAASAPQHPVLQSQKFDPDGRFIRRHVPELAHLGKDIVHTPWLAHAEIDSHGYPAPAADYAAQRRKAQALLRHTKEAV